MKRRAFSTFLLACLLPGACITPDKTSSGPIVRPHSQTGTVEIRQALKVVRTLTEAEHIEAVQDVFLRSRKTGDSQTHKVKATHTIDFSDRWLVDLQSGNLTILSKAVTPVYRMQPHDLEVLRLLILTGERLEQSPIN
ncbi:MAG: hypothetical protein AAF514_04220 [Verrucomicrobiota bacterium]